jgi:hypothetical protein
MWVNMTTLLKICILLLVYNRYDINKLANYLYRIVSNIRKISDFSESLKICQILIMYATSPLTVDLAIIFVIKHPSARFRLMCNR